MAETLFSKELDFFLIYMHQCAQIVNVQFNELLQSKYTCVTTIQIMKQNITEN